MSIYLPIAEMPVNVLVILMMSAAVGFLSGMVGVGGGFIMTPLLFLVGVPPAVAVATEASQITASSVSGALAHWRRRSVDLRMAALLSIGGVIGSVFGVQLFAYLRRLGQVDVLIALFYVFFLGLIGGLMVVESFAALRRRRLGRTPPRRKRQRTLAHILPLRMRFPRSGLYISIIPPLVIGALVGVLSAVMGVGGGFIIVPAMIYMLRMPTNVVIGTSLLQIVFVTALVTVLQSVQTKTVDLMLAALLIAGGVVGAQWGARAGVRMQGETLRAVLGVIVLGTALKILWDLIATPGEL
ncbi:MAG: sulfite exporter TauE/SafE family protein, partial [Hyphomonadaceae bacterium]